MIPFAVTCQHVCHRYGVHGVLHDVCWHIPPATCVALVGRSGAGKSTLLRLLAGLETPSAGKILFSVVGETPAEGAYPRGSERGAVAAGAYPPALAEGGAAPESQPTTSSTTQGERARAQAAVGQVRRSWPRVGMVFQSLGLWPHMTARQHVACVVSASARCGRGGAAAPIEAASTEKHQPRQRRARQQQVEDVLREVHLPPAVWDRLPAALSGGEGQRLALARALASDPEMLLLDEPLAQVDAPLRSDLLQLVAEVVRRRQASCVYVTHNGQEAMELATRIAVLEQGRLLQEGPAAEVYWRPASLEAARLSGPVVELPKRLWPDGPAQVAAEGVWDGGQSWLARPQCIELLEAEPGRRPAVPPHGRIGEILRVAWCRPHGYVWLVGLEGAARLALPARRAWQPGTAVRPCILTATNGLPTLYDGALGRSPARPRHAAETLGPIRQPWGG